MLRPQLFVEDVNTETKQVTVKIVPSKIFGGKTKLVVLSADEWAAIQDWRQGGILIQDALPRRSPAFRELFLTGMDDGEFHDYIGPEED